MSYVPWFGSVRSDSDRFGSSQPDPSDPVRSGSDQVLPDRCGAIRFGSTQFLSDRFDSDRFGSNRFPVICIIGKSPYPGNIPSIPDYTKYRIIIACTVTVQLPMRVLHGRCYSCTSGGDDQSPNVVHYCWTMV